MGPRRVYVVRRECAQDGFEVVDELGQRRVFEGCANAGRVERDFHGGVAVDGEAEAAGGIGGRIVPHSSR